MFTVIPSNGKQVIRLNKQQNLETWCSTA